MKGNTYNLTPARTDQLARAAENAMRHYHTLDAVISVNTAELAALAEGVRWAFAHGWPGIEIIMDEHTHEEAA
jgi:ribonuclease HI